VRHSFLLLILVVGAPHGAPPNRSGAAQLRPNSGPTSKKWCYMLVIIYRGSVQLFTHLTINPIMQKWHLPKILQI
jgi:hypothetical protein